MVSQLILSSLHFTTSWFVRNISNCTVNTSAYNATSDGNYKHKKVFCCMWDGYISRLQHLWVQLTNQICPKFFKKHSYLLVFFLQVSLMNYNITITMVKLLGSFNHQFQFFFSYFFFFHCLSKCSFWGELQKPQLL